MELGYFGGLSQTEIAERTGQPLGTVKTRMRLALQKLRSQLQVLGNDEGGIRVSDGMTHEQAREALEALALDALDASERDAVMAHVATCATCQSELAALERTASELAYAATPVPMPPRNATGSARG